MALVSRFRNGRRFVVAAALLATVAAGCTSRSHSARSTPTGPPLGISSVASTVTAPTSAVGSSSDPASAIVAPTPSQSATSAAAPAGSACTADQLELTLVDVSGAGGRSYSTYRMANSTARSCTLAQPAVSFRAASGVTVAQATATGPGATLTVRPGGSATFVVSDDNCAQPAAATQLVASVAGPAVLALSGQFRVCTPTITSLTAS